MIVHNIKTLMDELNAELGKIQSKFSIQVVRETNLIFPKYSVYLVETTPITNTVNKSNICNGGYENDTSLFLTGILTGLRIAGKP